MAAIGLEISRIKAADDLATLYFGGGTPSLATAAELAGILELLPAVSSLEEVTLEANPEDIELDVLRTWRDLGISRLSVGVQSLHDDELRPLGRLHGPERAIASLRQALEEGFRTNADLIIGLPGQTRNKFVASLEGVLKTGVGHLSLYVLDLDEDTPLRRRVEKGRTCLPDDDVVVELYMEAVERCGMAGLVQYEISNFARPGEESRHNLGYWIREPYRGVGLGAHSFEGKRRFANVRDIHQYLERSEQGGDVTDFEEVIGPDEEEEEEIFLSLRRSEGIELARLRVLRGERVTGWIERGLAAGAISLRGSNVAFTPRGFLLSSELISELF